MLKKKFFAKALAFAMVTGLMATSVPMGFAPQSIQVFAEAEDTTTTSDAPEITVDYSDYTAKIKLADAKYLFLEVCKDENGSKVSGTYGYKADADGSVTVDLSFLKANKKQYIRAYSDKLDEEGKYVKSEVKTIAAQPAKFSLKYDAAKGQLVDGKSKSEITLPETVDVDNPAVYEYKTLYGSAWEDLTEEALENKNVAGTTIIVRKAAVEEAAGKEGVPASAEVKVKIPAIPKAPKVTIDYVKGLVKLGKNTQYATLDKAIADTPDWTKTSDSAAKGVEIKKLLEELSSSPDGGTEESAARTAGDEIKLVVRTMGGGKKADSAWTFVALSPLDTLTKVEDESGKATAYTLGDKKLTWENTSKGIKLKAEGGAFDYYDEAKKAWKAVAAGKTVEVKLKNKKDLEVRAAGTKATKDKDGSFFTESVTLTSDLLAAKVTVTVNPETVKVNGTVTAKVEAVDGNGDKLTTNGEGAKEVSWKVTGAGELGANPTETATITATKAGEITITATVDGVTSKEVKVTVEAEESEE